MSAANDSVIICESPVPSETSTCMDIVTNYRKRLRSSRALLDTVYESPLVHLKRNIRPNETLTSANDGTLVSTPPAKKRKIKAASPRKNKGSSAKHDQSVIILNDSIAEPIVELALSDTETNDVFEVAKASQSVVLSTRKKKLKKKFSRVSKTLVKNRCMSQNAPSPKNSPKKKETNSGNDKTPNTPTKSLAQKNDENHDGQIMTKNTNTTGETEDIEVVWVSGPKSKPTSQSNASVNQPIVVDTSPNLNNLKKIVPLRTKKVKRLAELKKHAKKNNKSRFQTMGMMVEKDCRSAASLIFNGDRPPRDRSLREIVIDGCNVAMGHTHGRVFSQKGLEIVINYFRDRGHVVTAFLPQCMRTRDRELLETLHKQGFIVFTPSRKICGRHITPYDDRFILDYATKCNGIVISSDQYRDLWKEKPQWRNTIEKRLLAPTFVGDYLMFPEDPLGRTGPKLEDFLRF